jgi:Nuclease-related domain
LSYRVSDNCLTTRGVVEGHASSNSRSGPMPEGMTDGDEYFIQFRRSTATNKAGSGAREKANEERGKAPVRTVLARVLDAHTDERAWRRGAEGEERVGRQLSRLPKGWYVFHDLTIGSRGANLDHLVVGPGGVFALNTKNLTGNVWIGDHAIRHNGKRTDFLRSVKREAQSASERLGRAVGFPVFAVPVLVIFATKVTGAGRPPDVRVIEGSRIRRWLEKKPSSLSAEHAMRIARAADDPSIWVALTR